MARFDNEWERDRWERDEEDERERRAPRREAYTGWAGRGFNQGSFGRFGGQGSNLFSKYGGQGFGAQHGYDRREMGGGLSTYAGRDWGRDYEERRNAPRDNREEWGRDWGGQGFSGREGGWGGYGGYDRERASYEWPHRGQFAGRGPKGWRRSDDRIREDINERLTDHPDVDASEIEVMVQNGEVTLTGEVGDRETKRLAEDLADRVSGVRDVHNQLRVNRGFWGSIKDAFTGENSEETTSTRMITPRPDQIKEPAGARK